MKPPEGTRLSRVRNSPVRVLYLPSLDDLRVSQEIYRVQLGTDPGWYIPLLVSQDDVVELPDKDPDLLISSFLGSSRVEECSPADLLLVLWVCHQHQWILPGLPKKERK